MEYLFPSGLIDISVPKGDIKLGYARGGERFVPFGHEKIKHPENGEIIFYDEANNVLCGAWNSRGGKMAMIKPTTSDIIMDIDFFEEPSNDISSLLLALERARNLFIKYCGANIRIEVIGGTKSSISIK